MNTLSKSLATSLSVFLITACGGGSGGSENTSNNDTSANSGNIVSIPATTQNSGASSGHNTNELNFNTNIILNSKSQAVTGVTRIYNYDNPQVGLFVDHLDKIALFADGQKVDLNEDYSVEFGTSYSYTLPNNASSYEFSYTRNSELVSEGSIDSLPQAFGVAGVANGDEVSITLYKNQNHSYEYTAESLYCTAFNDYAPTNIDSIYSLNGEGVLTGDYQKNINTLFNKNVDNLKSDYSSCFVEVFFSSRSESINKELSSKNISIFTFATQHIEVELF